MKTNKKKYFASRQAINSFNKSKRNTREPIILLHKIGIEGMSRAMVDEQLAIYNKSIPKKFGNLDILNYVVLNGETTESDIKLLYPDFHYLKSELFEFLPNFKKRKVKIFELLNEL